jgi:hypothetical protein
VFKLVNVLFPDNVAIFEVANADVRGEVPFPLKILTPFVVYCIK